MEPSSVDKIKCIDEHAGLLFGNSAEVVDALRLYASIARARGIPHADAERNLERLLSKTLPNEIAGSKIMTINCMNTFQGTPFYNANIMTAHTNEGIVLRLTTAHERDAPEKLLADELRKTLGFSAAIAEGVLSASGIPSFSNVLLMSSGKLSHFCVLSASGFM